MEMDWLAWWTYNKTNNRTVSWANVITYKSRSVPVWIAHKLEIQKKNAISSLWRVARNECNEWNCPYFMAVFVQSRL